MSHNLRLIIKSLDNKESPELWRGAKSNLQIFNMLKEGAQPLPENFKICPPNSSETMQLSPEQIKALVGNGRKSAPQAKKESIYPEFRDQGELDNPSEEISKHSDPSCKIRIVGPHGEKLVN